MGKLVLGGNIKGGVGKSTTLNLLACVTKDSILYNIDQTQSVESVNSGGYSVDLIDEDIDIPNAVKSGLEDYEYIFLDTPSNFKPGQEDYERIISVLDQVDLFLIPLQTGSRSVEATLTTLDMLFGRGTTARTRPVKLLFILNDIILTGLKEDTLKKAKEYVHKNIIEDLNTIEFTVKIEKIYIDYFMHSKAIDRLEDEDITMDKLYESNRGGYRVINSKINEISKNIIEILKG